MTMVIRGFAGIDEVECVISTQVLRTQEHLVSVLFLHNNGNGVGRTLCTAYVPVYKAIYAGYPR